ncbi:hypothetical protein CNR22_11210 [Sphingobacteriaceae bacterium]|nr:hypothetical protein CNR22_11210 [Sphingobacteriaceae bacterium]
MIMEATYPKNKKRKRGEHILLVLFFFMLTKNYAQVGVNILTPHSSAAMQIESPAGMAKGLLTPTMTTVQRVSISSGTNTAADGLVVYDKDHHMHYYYHGSQSKWISMSPLALAAGGSSTSPSGIITTPAVSTTFSMGINKQNPSQALDVIGNTTVSGNISAGGNINVTGNANITGTLSIPGFASNALVPTGIIVMWSGTVVPLGWGLCDGGTYNGLLTPDLRGRFIVGVDNFAGTTNAGGQHLVYGRAGTTPAVAPNTGTVINYGTIGNTGGENGHTLVIAELPKHQHALQNGTDGSTSSITNTSIQDDISGFQSGGPLANGGGGAISNSIVNIKSHNHTLGGNSGDGTSSGLNNTMHENRPPYYVLAYIIKLP